MAKTKTRKLSASLEDYLEAILNLSDNEGHAHCTDIAKILNVAKPSVTGALRTLKKQGLANYEPYGSVTLTNKGKKTAEKVASKHRIIKSFFVNVLGINPDIAADAACKAEHAFGPEVISRLLTFSEYINENGKSGKTLIKRFKKFCDKQRSK